MRPLHRPFFDEFQTLLPRKPGRTHVEPMTKPPPSLQDLRREIDSIDEQVHELLMQRGDIIDRLISVKKTQEVGSAFRPAREADMMHRLVQRRAQ